MTSTRAADQKSFSFNFATCQRWSEQRERRLPSNGQIITAEYGVEPITRSQAANFIETHHYSGSMTGRRFSAGLYRKTGVAPARLVGVCVIGPGSNNLTIPKWCGLSHENGAELTRLVLLDEVAGNGESFFVSKVFRALRQEKPEIQSIVSFADPVERQLPDGSVVKPGHFGSIYQALSGIYAGTSTARWIWLDRSGRVVSARSVEKIKIEDPRGASTIRQLLNSGAPERHQGEHPADWLKRVLPIACTRHRHPGNHAFVWGLTAGARVTARRNLGQPVGTCRPYPKPDILGRHPPIIVRAA